MIDTTKYRGAVTYRGIPFEWGLGKLIVPVITCRQAEEPEMISLMSKDVAIPRPAMDAMADEWDVWNERIRDKIRSLNKVSAVAIRRNYPDITDEELGDFFTSENSLTVYQAAVGSSGKEKVRSPEEPAPLALGQTSTGQASTGA